jgi:hypothetical protein
LHRSNNRPTFAAQLTEMVSVVHIQKVKGTLAQLVEHRIENPCVPGSNPGGTTYPQAVQRKLYGFFCIFKTQTNLKNENYLFRQQYFFAHCRITHRFYYCFKRLKRILQYKKYSIFCIALRLKDKLLKNGE